MRSKAYQLTKHKYLTHPGQLEVHLNKHLKLGDRNALMLMLALKTGARATELLNITCLDLDDQTQSIYIRGIKGSNDREIPLTTELYARVKSRAREVQGKLFPISYSRLVQIWSLYRTEPKKFHSLRHTFAIELYKKTRDLRLVQVALGHRSISNTMVYADYVYSTEELRRLIL